MPLTVFFLKGNKIGDEKFLAFLHIVRLGKGGGVKLLYTSTIFSSISSSDRQMSPGA